MNIHHLELFYYVARHGGIAGAVRNIPYGIQQPAVSRQIAQLEDHLGLTLFQRRPFALSPPGKKLFDFIAPFFANLETMEAELQGGLVPRLRLGAAVIVLRDYFPQILQNLRKKFSGLKLGLREGSQPELEHLLRKGEIDLAVTLLETKSGPGIQTMALLELPLVLLVPKEGKITDANQLWRRDKITETLICLPPDELVSRNFQKRGGLDTRHRNQRVRFDHDLRGRRIRPGRFGGCSGTEFAAANPSHITDRLSAGGRRRVLARQTGSFAAGLY